ncbi:MAG: hypothetical protein ACKOYJ_07625, partial [Planctomycetia bacterium]
ASWSCRCFARPGGRSSLSPSPTRRSWLPDDLLSALPADRAGCWFGPGVWLTILLAPAVVMLLHATAGSRMR